MDNSSQKPVAAVENSYAVALEWVSTIGVIACLAAYLFYIFDLLPLSVSVRTISEHWGISADEAAAKGVVLTGWEWIEHLPNADMLSLASIALLTITPMICLAVASMAFLKLKDHAYTIISILQIIVLLIAVSGFFSR
ncbi:MAG: hypothetical protein HGB11_00530 [Chlorobiales bacterium]|nr:hypothetical protein [Chlorobiales bacterium]